MNYFISVHILHSYLIHSFTHSLIHSFKIEKYGNN